jgi:hypothetical protein
VSHCRKKCFISLLYDISKCASWNVIKVQPMNVNERDNHRMITIKAPSVISFPLFVFHAISTAMYSREPSI